MASATPKNTVGATVMPVSTPTRPHVPPSFISAQSLTPAASKEDFKLHDDDDDGFQKPPPIHSPFYQHPPASFERVPHSRNGSAYKVNTNVFEKDVESLVTASPMSRHGKGGDDDEDNYFSTKVSVDCNKECRMWPSRQTLIRSKRETKRQKWGRTMCGGLAPLRDRWAHMTKKQKLIAHLLIALLVVGIMVAIGVGISVAVGGGVYSSHGSHQIGDGNQ